MSNVVTFTTRTFSVLFNLPDDKVIHMTKSSRDNVEIYMDGQHGTAIVNATTKRAAENTMKKIFPKCIIVDVIAQ